MADFVANCTYGSQMQLECRNRLHSKDETPLQYRVTSMLHSKMIVKNLNERDELRMIQSFTFQRYVAMQDLGVARQKSRYCARARCSKTDDDVEAVESLARARSLTDTI
jgi:hypothetical protein